MLTEPLPSPHRASTGARVTLCGALSAEIGGRRIDQALPGHKGRQLFVCLVVSRRRPMSRDELIHVVWPDDSPADPDGAFSTLLTRLRTALGRDVVLGRSELVLDLGDDACVDWDVARDSVAAAERRLAAGDPRAALRIAEAGLDIVRRPLLPGVSTPWIEDRRRQLVEWWAALLETCGRAALTLGGAHLPAAERNARELIEREPYRESAYALLMDSHAARGNIAEALRVYDDVRRLLREELGITPAPPLTALAERLLAQKDAGPPAVAAAPAVQPAPVRSVPGPLPPALAAVAMRPLAGRGAELREALAAVRDASARRRTVVMLEGEAGIGKTRLAAAIAAAVHDDGREVLHGAVSRGAVAPFRPFAEALRRHLAHDDEAARDLAPVLAPELGELARIVPELRTVVPAAPDDEATDASIRAQRLFDAVGGLCVAAARRRPLLLVVEDLQWADPLTLSMLAHVALAVQDAPVSILVTLRDDEPLRPELRALLLDLLRARALARLVLPALDDADVAELVAAQGDGVPAPGTIDAIRAEAGGNPFFVEELLCVRDGDDRLPDGLRDAVESRLQSLPEATREALAIAAAGGRSFDVAAVATEARAPRAAMLAALAPCVHAGLLVVDGARRDRLRFRHGLVRRALLAR